MVEEFTVVPRLLVILTVMLFPMVAQAYHGEILVQLKSFNVEVADGDNQRSIAPITVFAHLIRKDSVESFCRREAAIRRIIKTELKLEPIPIEDGEMNFTELAKRASVLMRILAQSWQKQFTTHLYLLPGAHEVGEEGAPVALKGTNSKCMSLKKVPPYLVSHLRRLNVPGTDTENQAKLQIKEHVTHPFFADSGEEEKLPETGVKVSGNTEKEVETIVEEKLFETPDLAKDWKTLHDPPPVPAAEKGLEIPIWLWVILIAGGSVAVGGMLVFMFLQVRSNRRRRERRKRKERRDKERRKDDMPFEGKDKRKTDRRAGNVRRDEKNRRDGSDRRDP